MKNLSKEQIVEIADRLDDLIGNNFADICYAVTELEIEDADVYKIKAELAEGYLAEYKRNN